MPFHHQRWSVLLGLVAVLSGCGGSATAPARVTNYETKGNLESSNNIGCAKASGLRNDFTAADLYRGIPVCVKQGDFEAGAFLFAIAGVYGRYDALRVADASARQAATVLRMTYVDSLDDESKEKLLGAVTAALGTPERLATTCAQIRTIGAPNYHPTYMVQHGMGAFLGGAGKNGLAESFDGPTGWEQSLSGYLHCPAIEPK